MMAIWHLILAAEPCFLTKIAAIFYVHHYFSNYITDTMPPAAVPETVLRKRRRDEEWAAKKAAAATEVRDANTTFGGVDMYRCSKRCHLRTTI